MTDRPWLTCIEVIDRLNDYLDRNLSTGEAALVARHLDDCVACAREYRFDAMMLECLKTRLRRIHVPPHLLSSVKLLLQAESIGR